MFTLQYNSKSSFNNFASRVILPNQCRGSWAASAANKFIKIKLKLMLIGQKYGENEREKKAKKSQIYKEMLDNQIIMNEQYRKGHSPQHKERDLSQLTEQNFIPTLIHRPNLQMEDSIVRDLDPKPEKSRSRFLPLLKDKHTFYRGSSKYLKVQDPGKPHKEAKHVYTEQIQERESEEEDQYYSTCERIIKELQGIKSKPVRFRARRRVYDMSEMVHRRANHPMPRNQSNQQRYSSKDKETSPPSMNLSYQLNKPLNNPESRYHQYLNRGISSTKKSLNEFEESRVEQKTSSKYEEEKEKELSHGKKAVQASKMKQISSFSNEFESQQALRADPRYEMQNERKKISSTFERGYNVSSIQAKTKEKSKLSPLEIKQKESSQKFQEEASRLANQRLEVQRQNFLQLLRKVKNRGESLYMKFAKIPCQK